MTNVPINFQAPKPLKIKIKRLLSKREEESDRFVSFKSICIELLEAALDLPEYKNLLPPTPSSNELQQNP
ncbi:hypothetical protein BKI52_12570 [marine bacterium AO1-C]|nr:hypothetical protein BKI52_12570 [marine bacterium AO1-C]